MFFRLPPLASGEKNESNQMDDFRAFRSEIIKSLFRRGAPVSPFGARGFFRLLRKAAI